MRAAAAAAAAARGVMMIRRRSVAVSSTHSSRWLNGGRAAAITHTRARRSVQFGLFDETTAFDIVRDAANVAERWSPASAAATSCEVRRYS